MFICLGRNETQMCSIALIKHFTVEFFPDWSLSVDSLSLSVKPRGLNTLWIHRSLSRPTVSVIFYTLVPLGGRKPPETQTNRQGPNQVKTTVNVSSVCLLFRTMNAPRIRADPASFSTYLRSFFILIWVVVVTTFPSHFGVCMTLASPGF